jgi:long-chain acyl-CoA synthetase
MSAAERPWRAFYGPGVRAEIEAPPYRTIAELAGAGARMWGDRPAFTCVLPNGMAGELTFAEVDRLSDAFAVYLREVAGLNAGDRVAIQLPNSLPYPVAAFGVFKAGCVLVNVNPLYTAEEMSHQFADAEPHALIIIDLFADKLPAALRHQPVPNIIVTSIADYFPAFRKFVVGAVQKYVKKQVPPIEVPHIRFTDAVERGRARLDEKRVEVAGYTAGLGLETVACLQYTGGTTGVSKGAMLTHGNLITNASQMVEMCGQNIARGEEVLLTVLPLYHIFAFTVNFLGFFWLGAQNILVPSPRPITNLRKPIEKYPITWITGVNTLFNALLHEAWFKDAPPRSLKRSAAGGMALHSAVAERWQQVTGTPVIEGYGLTETSPVLTFNPFGKERPDSIGVPVPSTDIRCFDEEGREVPIGMPGELGAKGPQVMAGYWRRPDETQRVMRDGWLLTGDIAVMDTDGYFRIVDRKKDMVLVSGFNVYPNEVEEVLAKHPGILEAAVIGVPDPTTGEAVKAFVVVKDPSLRAEDIRAYCREHLTSYKVPKQVEFRSELPKSNVGKILRKDLRQEALAKVA